MSKTISRTWCSQCNKKNLCTFLGTNGLEYIKCQTLGCNSVQANEPKKQEFISAIELDFQFPKESYRGIRAETCQFLGIKIAELGDTTVVSYDHNNLDGTFSLKRRYPNKAFDWSGKTETTSMFALDKCVDFNKPLYITEGNEDCATLWDLGFQACSIHCAGAEKDNIELDLETINKYPEIIICIEDDKAGKQVKNNIKNLLAHKLLREVDLSPRKDANEWVQNGVEDDVQELMIRLFDAKEIVPKGIEFGTSIDFDDLYKALPPAIPTGFEKLDELLGGGYMRGTLAIVTGGTSIAKSTYLRHKMMHFKGLPDIKVGGIFVEESSKTAKQALLALHFNIPIGDLMKNPSLYVKPAEWKKACDEILYTDDLMFVNEKWENNVDSFIKTCEYLINVKKYDIIILDHLTAIINGEETNSNRVQQIDLLMEKLFALVKNTNSVIIVSVHLKRPDRPPYWDEGREPSIYDLKGSGSLEQKPDTIITLSRNMKDPFSCDLLKTHVRKNRWNSLLGDADELVYISKTGRLVKK